MSNEPSVDHQTPSDASQHASATGWTISDSEWNGYVERTQKQARRGIFGTMVLTQIASIVIAGAFLSFDLLSASANPKVIFSPLIRVFWIAIIVLNTYQAVNAFRRTRRAARAVAMVRAEDGCVCPLCSEPCAPRTADGFAPRCRHGVSRDARDALVQCWQALAHGDVHATGRLFAELPASSAPRGILARWIRFTHRQSAKASDSERPLWERYRAGFPLSLNLLPIALFPFVFPSIITGSGFIATFTVPIILGMIFVAPLIFMSGATRPTRKERCRDCRQLVMLPRPKHCTECGADFARAGAIQTVMATKDWRFALVGGALMVGVLALAMSLSLGLGASLLPTPVLLTLAPYSGGSQMTRELETRTLTAKERADFVRLQIAHAAPSSSFMRSRPSPRFQSNMLLPAVAAGDLPDSAIDDALRAIVQLDATMKQTADGAQFVLTPTFGSDLFDRAGDVWVVFRGVAFEDSNGQSTEPVGASTNPIDRWSVDPIWRDGFRRQKHPTEFAVACPEELHRSGQNAAPTATWKATVVLLPFAKRPVFSFAQDGSLVLPPGTIRSIDLEGTLQLED
jgi:hypothetical protein